MGFLKFTVMGLTWQCTCHVVTTETASAHTAWELVPHWDEDMAKSGSVIVTPQPANYRFASFCHVVSYAGKTL